MMRRLALPFALLCSLACLSFGQQAQGIWDQVFQTATDGADAASGKSVFQIARPDIVIEIYKHNVGADMFDIRAVKPGYPPALLAQQAAKIGEYVGTPIRGLAVGRPPLGGDPNLTFTRATFATNGIIDRDKGVLRVEPIVKAFAGASPGNEVRGITIMFNREQATPAMLKSYSSPYVRLQAIADQNPAVIEYRVQLLTQDPKLVQIPESVQPEQKGAPIASTEKRNGVDWGLWIPVVAGAIAAGVLVYYFMMRSSAKPRR